MGHVRKWKRFFDYYSILTNAICMQYKWKMFVQDFIFSDTLFQAPLQIWQIQLYNTRKKYILIYRFVSVESAMLIQQQRLLEVIQQTDIHGWKVSVFSSEFRFISVHSIAYLAATVNDLMLAESFMKRIWATYIFMFDNNVSSLKGLKRSLW